MTASQESQSRYTLRVTRPDGSTYEEHVDRLPIAQHRSDYLQREGYAVDLIDTLE